MNDRMQVLKIQKNFFSGNLPNSRKCNRSCTVLADFAISGSLTHTGSDLFGRPGEKKKKANKQSPTQGQESFFGDKFQSA